MSKHHLLGLFRKKTTKEDWGDTKQAFLLLQRTLLKFLALSWSPQPSVIPVLRDPSNSYKLHSYQTRHTTCCYACMQAKPSHLQSLCKCKFFKVYFILHKISNRNEFWPYSKADLTFPQLYLLSQYNDTPLYTIHSQQKRWLSPQQVGEPTRNLVSPRRFTVFIFKCLQDYLNRKKTVFHKRFQFDQYLSNFKNTLFCCTGLRNKPM